MNTKANNLAAMKSSLEKKTGRILSIIHHEQKNGHVVGPLGRGGICRERGNSILSIYVA